MKTVLNFSGGKDSTYLILFCREKNIKVDRYVFYDSTLELPCVHEHISNIEKLFNINVERIKPKKKFFDLFYKTVCRGKNKGKVRGFPPVVGKGCWIRRDLKLYSDNKDEIPIVGFTSDEEHRRGSLYGIFPFLKYNISAKEVMARCKTNDIYPPLYYLLERFGCKIPRSGCWLCPKCSVGWSRLLYFKYPLLWQELKYLEYFSPHGWKPNYTTRGLSSKFALEAAEAKKNPNAKNAPGLII